MNNYKTISELKSLAKYQMKGKLSLLMSIVMLQIIFVYFSDILISSVVQITGPVGIITRLICMFFVSILTGVLHTGEALINLKCSCRINATIVDAFYGYKNEPQKSIVAQMILLLIEIICWSPAAFCIYKLSFTTDFLKSYYELMEYMTTDPTANIVDIMNKEMELLDPYTPLMTGCLKLVFWGFIANFLLSIPFKFVFYMIIDFPNCNILEIINKSFMTIKNHIFRYILLVLSFVPLLILGACLYFVGLLFVIPYMRLTLTNFYLDIMSKKNKELAN